MTHYGSMETHLASDQVQDIRGAIVRGLDGNELGTFDDIVFDHDSMEIVYLVVDSGCWLPVGAFLLPAGEVSSDLSQDDGLATGVSRSQIKDSPQYDKKSLRSEDEWEPYEAKFKEYWEEDPVMHMKGSDRIITPPEEHARARTTAIDPGNSGSVDRELDAAHLVPDRISDVFSDPAPGAGKVTLRPKSIARAEEAARGVALLKPRWWDAFENYLRMNKSDVQSKCSQCDSTATTKAKRHRPPSVFWHAL